MVQREAGPLRAGARVEGDQVVAARSAGAPGPAASARIRTGPRSARRHSSSPVRADRPVSTPPALPTTRSPTSSASGPSRAGAATGSPRRPASPGRVVALPVGTQPPAVRVPVGRSRPGSPPAPRPPPGGRQRARTAPVAASRNSTVVRPGAGVDRDQLAGRGGATSVPAAAAGTSTRQSCRPSARSYPPSPPRAGDDQHAHDRRRCGRRAARPGPRRSRRRCAGRLSAPARLRPVRPPGDPPGTRVQRDQLPSDQRLTTVVPLGHAPRPACAGQRRYDQNGVTRCFPSTGWSA